MNPTQRQLAVRAARVTPFRRSFRHPTAIYRFYDMDRVSSPLSLPLFEIYGAVYAAVREASVTNDLFNTWKVSACTLTRAKQASLLGGVHVRGTLPPVAPHSTRGKLASSRSSRRIRRRKYFSAFCCTRASLKEVPFP